MRCKCAGLGGIIWITLEQAHPCGQTTDNTNVGQNVDLAGKIREFNLRFIGV